MALNHRRFIATGTTVSGGAAFALAREALVDATKPSDLAALRQTMHPGAYRLLLNTMGGVTNDSNTSGRMKLALSLVLRLLDEHPDLFDLDAVMRAPVDQIRYAGATYQVEARTRKLRTLMTFERSNRSDAEICHAMADDIAAEMRHERAHPFNCGLRICPYMPIVPSSVVVDPQSFEPIINFRTRFGLFHPGTDAIS